MDGSGDHPVKWNKPDTEKYIFSHMQKLDLKKEMVMNINGGLTGTGPVGGGGWKERVRGKLLSKCILYMYEKVIMKLTYKNCKKDLKRWGEE
jgi:hypothetical protein